MPKTDPLTPEQLRERRLQVMRRRLRAVGTKYNMPPLSGIEMHAASNALANTVGEGITEPDMRTIYRLTKRGLFS